MSEELLGTQGERVAARYELRAQAPGFGLAETWRAVDTHTSRPVMVKLLLAATSTAAAWLTVVTRLRALGSPHLPAYLDGGVMADAQGRSRRHLVFDELEGRTLASWIDGHAEAATSPGPGVVLRLFDAIGRAVQVGHGLGGSKPLLHRGLSPSSVVMKAHPGGHQVWVLDHELAPFVGTGLLREHMAPEQNGPAGRETPATDVFAMGVILVQLFTGCARPTPEERETWWQWVEHPRERDAFKKLLGRVRDDIPDAVTDVIAQALHRDPTKRFADAQQFTRRLRQALPPAWKHLPSQEPEPPFPTRLAAVSAPPSAQRRGPSASVPVGWQEAERRHEVAPATPLPAAPSPAPPPPPVEAEPPPPVTLLDARGTRRQQRPVEHETPVAAGDVTGMSEETLALDSAAPLDSDWMRAPPPQRFEGGDGEPRTAVARVPRPTSPSAPAPVEETDGMSPLGYPTDHNTTVALTSEDPEAALTLRQVQAGRSATTDALDALPIWPAISLQSPAAHAPPYIPASSAPPAVDVAPPVDSPSVMDRDRKRSRRALIAVIGATLLAALMALALSIRSR